MATTLTECEQKRTWLEAQRCQKIRRGERGIIKHGQGRYTFYRLLKICFKRKKNMLLKF